ncbi:MAG: hypothetical protein JW801_17520 [Bacteroidales bacterium]|nr:hypothetical protein [Bacteroidales bacterium]
MASTSEKGKKNIPGLLDIMQFPKLDLIFSKYLTSIFYISLFLMVFFGLLQFDSRISIGGDDSDYLKSAMEFSRGESFPSFHGVFYTLLIGWMIKLTGFQLIVFKLLSLLFLLGHQVFFFLSFRRHVSPFLLGAVLLITSVSSGLLYYGSHTFTETFYMFLQSGLIYLIVSMVVSGGEGFLLKKYWKFYLGAGVVIFMMAATRNIGYAALGAVLVFFLLEKKYLQGLGVFAGYLLVTIPYSIYKKAAWGVQGSDLGAQMQILMQKDPYNPSFGHESFSGFFTRFYENAGYYLSTVFLQESGFQKTDNPKSFYLVSILIIALLIAGFIFACRKKQKVFKLVFLYTGAALIITLLSLNPMWRQSRLLIIFMPLLLLLLFYTLAETANLLDKAFIRAILVGLLGVVFLSNFVRSMGKASEMSQIRDRVQKGTKFSGYTPDYRNFLELSEWAAENTPKGVSIGSRKASMSFIYGKGHRFYPLYKLQFVNTNKLLSEIDQDTPVFFMNDLDLEGKNAALVSSLKVYLKAIISFEDDVYSMYQPGTDALLADSLLRELSIEPIRSVSRFKNELVSGSKRTTSMIPDELLDNLYRNHVHYLINASLRVNPDMKTDRVINTIERYMVAINSKYPGVFTLVKQVGENQDEPARLYKVNYEYCKSRGWEPAR